MTAGGAGGGIPVKMGVRINFVIAKKYLQLENIFASIHTRRYILDTELSESVKVAMHSS